MGERARLIALLAIVASCNDPVVFGRLETVPPVHRVPVDVVGTVVLLNEDAEIQTKDPIHIQRAKEVRVPQDYRASMVEALGLAGFKVSADATQPYALHAKLALAVSEDAGKVRQLYRCNLSAPDGKEVAQIDWPWPDNTRVDGEQVYNYATHHLATEIATSRAVNEYLHTHK